MSEPAIGGLWNYPSSPHPGESDYLFVDEARRRILCFLAYARDDKPLTYLPMKSWFQRTSPTAIATRVRLSDPALQPDLQLSGDSLFLDWGTNSVMTRRVPPEEWLAWLPRKLEKLNAKMDEEEQNEQNAG